MYMTSISRPATAHDGPPRVDWLIDRDNGGLASGRIGILQIGGGQEAMLAPAGARELTAYVVAGDGAAGEAGQQAIESGYALFVPRGQSLTVRAGRAPVRLLVVEAELSGQMTEASSGGRVRVVAAAGISSAPYHDPALGFWHVAARWLVDSALAGSKGMVVGQSEFAPGSAHLHHRHDSAEEFFSVLEGEGVHLIEGGEVAMAPGDIVVVPRNEWHGFRNTGGEKVRALFGYLGTPSVEEGGYEVKKA